MKKNLLFLLLFSASDALAGGGSASVHHEAPGLSSLVWPAINFAIYFYIIARVYKKSLKPALIGKEVLIKKEIETAKTELLTANSNLEVSKKRQENLENEKQEIAEKIAKEGKMLATNIVEEAKAQSEKIARDVKLRASRELSKVRSGIKAEIVKRALNNVEKELKGSLSEAQDSELRKDALRSVLG